MSVGRCGLRQAEGEDEDEDEDGEVSQSVSQSAWISVLYQFRMISHLRFVCSDRIEHCSNIPIVDR